ncbi:MAG: DUF4907 domain-containing protein [Prolixibacteraceae bacterium]|nr:DUF4907 domain-containing protein [Prolixibacteraceae bacterium]
MTKRSSHRLILVIVLMALGASVWYIQQRSPVSKKNGTSFVIPDKGNFSARVIQLNTKAWAYEILIDTIPYIHQAFIPGIAGNQAFESAEEARKCSELVLKKLRNKQIPSISRKELDELGIAYQ